MKRKLRMGMVGGGKDAFIGAVHRIAANMDGLVELVCGVFSITATVSQETAVDLFIPPNRVYASYQEMIERRANCPKGSAWIS